MTTIGQIAAYTEGTSFSSWVERLEQFFAANDIADARKVPVLLTVVGETAYDLLRNILAPEKPANHSFDALIEQLKGHYEPKPLIIGERFRFHRRDQRDGETVANFIAELKRLAVHCNFGAALDDSIRDRLVCGLRYDHIQKRLLSEADLPLKKACSLAIALESADAQARELKGARSDAVHYRDHRRGRGGHFGSGHGQGSKIDSSVNSGKKHQNGPCKCCGDTSHGGQSCRFRNATCYNCHKKGHIGKVCRAPKSRSQGSRSKRAHHVRDGDADLENSDTDANAINHVRHVNIDKVLSVSSKAPYILRPVINGEPVTMEVDTGSYWTIISRSTWTKLQRPSLKRCNVRLELWSDNPLQVFGQCRVPVQLVGAKRSLIIIVADGNGPSLCGRQWLQNFGLETKIKNILGNVVKSPQDQDYVKSSAVKPQPCYFTGDHRLTLQQILDNYKDIFDGKLGSVPDYRVKLEINPEARPVFLKARPVAYALKPKIDAELDRLESDGVISRVEFSDWATPLVPVLKTDGSVRLCGDYKTSLNPVLHVNQYPLPKAEDLFVKLRGGQQFTKIDLSNAYQQLMLDDESRKLTVINTQKGLYQYNRLPFGVAPASAIFQKFMEQVLAGIPGVCDLVDDILVTGCNEQEHLERLDQVLSRLSKHNLRAKLSKCSFLQPEVEYLGHRVDSKGLHPLENKLRAIRDAPLPQNISELRSFLGLVQYYAKFIPNLSDITAPLTELLRKEAKWVMNSMQRESIKKLKGIITSDQVLVHYDEKLPLRLSCDASSVGIGAVISHVMSDGSERPICFASRTLSTAERRYAQIEREALSIIFGVVKFRQYLLARNFTLVTDHKPLVKILGPKTGIPTLAADRLQRWALTLSSFTYEIVYRSTSNHGNADALSRMPLTASEEMEISSGRASTILNVRLIEDLPFSPDLTKDMTRKDSTISRVLEHCLKGWPESIQSDPEVLPYFQRRDELGIEDGIVLWGRRVVVPTKLRQRVLEDLHEAHPGVVRMKAVARSHCWWPKIDSDIEALAQNCQACQETRKSPQSAPLTPYQWPHKPWSRIHIDFAGPFIGHMYLIVVDSHSKWAEVAVMKETTAERTINVLRSLFARYGLPERIVSDNGPQFTSDEFAQFLRRNSIRHILTPPYHPQSNGEAERFVQTFKRAMKASNANSKSIHEWNAKFLFQYRRTPHATTGVSPVELFLGRQVRTRLDLLRPDVRKRVERNQEKQSQIHDKNRRKAREYAVGSLVYARNYRAGSTWVPGRIYQRVSTSVYLVEVNGQRWKRHVDQLNSRVSNGTCNGTEACTDNWPVVAGGANSLVGSDPSGTTGSSTLVSTSSTLSATTATQGHHQPNRRYPDRDRRPVDRMGL